MGTIRSNIGLASGINTGQLVDQLITLQRAPIVRLENRVSGFQSTDAAIKSLDAALLSISAAAKGLGNESNFNSFNVSNSDETQLFVETNNNASLGTFQFQTIRSAINHKSLSKGFVDANNQAIGSGTLSLSKGGRLDEPTFLDALNGAAGSRRGKIQITDRAGQTAQIDLTNAITLDEVVSAINSNRNVSVRVDVAEDHLAIIDESGGSAGDLEVKDLAGGFLANDLKIAGTSNTGEIVGGTIFSIVGSFRLDQIDDGNGLRRLNGAPDISITLTDDSVLDVNLDAAVTLNDVVNLINDHADNNGKLLAEFQNGRFQLTDLSGGGGTSGFTITDDNNSSVIRSLGLETVASNGQIVGSQVAAGLNSVLLRNLNGGKGIDTLGQVSLTDRTGQTALIDFTGVQSLGEVLHRIDTAKTSTGNRLSLRARVNGAGTGLEISDTSAGTGNLVVADVGTSTLAGQLGIEFNAASSSLDSGSLQLRYVNEATSLDGLTKSGTPISTGDILITDSGGNSATVSITGAVKNVGDAILRINTASGVAVRAELNSTGDGFVLIDEAGGPGTLSVEDLDANAAKDLKLTGVSVIGSDGKQRLDSRFRIVIDVSQGETLNDLVNQINGVTGFATASTFDDRSPFSPSHLVLRSNESGRQGRFVVEDLGLNLGLNTLESGQDALLQIGNSDGTALLVTSSNDRFENAVTGLDVTVLEPGSSPAEVTVVRDDKKVRDTITTFVDGLNEFFGQVDDQTGFDTETKVSGILQGNGAVLRAEDRLNRLISTNTGGSGKIRSLFDLGIRILKNGKLSINNNRLDKLITEDPEAVSDFFLNKKNGFSKIAEESLKQLTNTETGSLALEQQSIQKSVKSLSERITLLEVLLQGKRDRLLIQFAQMEQTLSSLQSQQQALPGISSLSITPAGRGIL